MLAIVQHEFVRTSKKNMLDHVHSPSKDDRTTCAAATSASGIASRVSMTLSADRAFDRSCANVQSGTTGRRVVS